MRVAFTDEEALGDLRIFARLHGERGYSPTVSEFMDAAGYSSTSVANYHLRALEARGWVTLSNGLARSRVLTDTGRELVEEAKQ